MTPARQMHESMMAALRERSFRCLEIKRLGSTCYLVITIDDEAHVFVNRIGERSEYRHAWQVRNWLMSNFGIPPESVPVEVI